MDERHEHPPASWASLDAFCLLQIFAKLDAKSLARVACVNRESASLARTCSLWAPLLRGVFGLEAEAKSKHQAALQQAFALLTTTKQRYPVRFSGAYTDSGVDERSPVYWADNLFV